MAAAKDVQGHQDKFGGKVLMEAYNHEGKLLGRVLRSVFASGCSQASDPDKVEKTVSTPPKHYGNIDFADFDPENWKGQGR